VTTTPRQPGQPSQSRLRRYAAGLAAAGLLSTPLLFTATGSAVADQETPAERCQRQTAEYNAAMETAWRAAHPGQEPTGNEWPPFVCHDIPTPTLPPGPPPGGGDNGNGAGGAGESGAGRTHQYEGFNRPDSEYQQDMDLGGLGGPRTGLSERMGASEPTDPTRPSAGDTARSNVRQVIPWNTTVTDDNGDSRQVRVVDTPDGPAVVADDGTATGEVLTTDTDSGVTSTTRRDGLEGRQLTDPTTNGRADRDDTDDTSSATSTSAAVPAGTSGDHAANGSNGGNGTGGDGDQGGSGGDLPVGPLGAGGLLAGAAGAILADRRRRDGAHRGDINWGNGREQSLILLEGPDSPREHSFDMDVPAGGQMVKNPDGSVDVLDADGNIVEHVKAPWAFDALGRPVETYYEVDNDNGKLVQVVDPDRTSVLPILADPDKQKSEPLKPSDPGFHGPVLAEDAQAQKEAREAEGYVPTPGEAQDPRFPDGPPEPDPEQQRRDNNNLSIAANSNQNPADVPQDPAPTPTPQPAPYTPEQIDDNNDLSIAANSNQNPADTDSASGTSAADVTRNAPPVGAGVSTPKDPDPDGRTGGTANQQPLTDAPSEYGHQVAKDPDGAYDIDPLGLDEDSEVIRFDDGSAQIEEDNGDITRYLPAPEDGGEGGGNFAESIHYDAATDQTTQVMIQNGQRTEVTKPGKPDSAAPEGSPEASGALGTIPTNPQGVFVDPNTPRADPAIAGQAVQDVGPINPADPPSVVNHPGQNSADVSPGDGQQSVRVNPQTGEQIGLGTTDNPKEGPFVPRTFDWVPEAIDDADTVAGSPDAGEVFPDNSVPEGVVAGVSGADRGRAVNQTVNEEYGRHAAPHSPSVGENIIQRAGKGVAPIGAGITAYNTATAEDPGEQAAKEGISWGITTATATGMGVIGGMIGGPPGAMILGTAGGLLGDWIGERVGNAALGQDE
jgi:hypothetical protein